MSPTSDIDCLCVVPKYVNRHNDFFGSFYDILDEHDHVSDLVKVETAYVPVMKLKFRKIEIDLTFARIDKNDIQDLSEKDLMNDEIF